MCKAGTGAVPTDLSFGSGDTLVPLNAWPRLCKQLHRCVEAWKLCCWCIIFQAHGCCCKGYWKHGSLSKHTALPLQARDGCCCPGWRWKTHAWKAYCQWLIIAVWKPWLLLIKYTVGAAQGILFSVCDCSHCVFSKHIRPKSFFKTHIQQTKTKQTYITNTYYSKSDEELCVILALIPLCYPRPEPPSQECWTLGCTSGIRVGCWHWYLGASWAAKNKQMFSLPHKPHFF